MSLNDIIYETVVDVKLCKAKKCKFLGYADKGDYLLPFCLKNLWDIQCYGNLTEKEVDKR